MGREPIQDSCDAERKSCDLMTTLKRSALAWLKLCRPWQWTKNLLVFAAPVSHFGVNIGPVWFRTATLFASFCLISSGVYCLNDASDVERDKQHPRKKNRPLPQGLITPFQARSAAVALIATGTGMAALVSTKCCAVVFAYTIINVAYSSRLKNVEVLELSIVAGGFVLRALAGGYAADVNFTSWFLLVTMFGSLLIVIGKRVAEVGLMGEDKHSIRESLAKYPKGFLDQILTASAAATLVSYCLFVFNDENAGNSSNSLYGLSAVPFVLTIFRYLLLVARGDGGEPEMMVFRDRTLFFFVLAWGVVFVGAATIP